MAFREKLAAASTANQSLLCVGLDIDPDLMGERDITRFCSRIVDATADLVCAYKPNLSFFEALGMEGYTALLELRKIIPADIPVIGDAKRGDIGNTSAMAAKGLFDVFGFDAVTVNPYGGYDAVEPFLKYENRGIYILCLTSNEGAKDFQVPGDVYLRVAEKASEWNTVKNIGLVVGATKASRIKKIRAVAPDLPILIPGLGEQGGSLEDTVHAMEGAPRHYMLFNVSRSILFASDGADYGHAARKAARYYRDMINRAREKTIHD